MPVSEERLTVVATHDARRNAPQVSARNPVARLMVASLARTHREHERSIRDASAFLLDLLSANEPEGPRLTLSVGMRVLTREETTPIEDVHRYLARATYRDVLLGIAVHGLISRSLGVIGSPVAGRREAVTRALFLLLRMFEAQAEVDDLHRHFAIDARSP